MPISLELSARLHNTATRDEAMLEVAYEYIFALGVDIAEISGAEGLDAHTQSVQIRLKGARS